MDERWHFLTYMTHTSSTSARLVTGPRTPGSRLIYVFSRRSAWVAALAGILPLLSHSLHAAVTEAWVHRYSRIVSNSVDQAFKVLSDAAGDIIVAGTSDNGSTGRNM